MEVKQLWIACIKYFRFFMILFSQWNNMIFFSNFQSLNSLIRKTPFTVNRFGLRPNFELHHRLNGINKKLEFFTNRFAQWNNLKFHCSKIFHRFIAWKIFLEKLNFSWSNSIYNTTWKFSKFYGFNRLDRKRMISSLVWQIKNNLNFSQSDSLHEITWSISNFQCFLLFVTF